MNFEDFRDEVQGYAKGALFLQVAYVGVSGHFFDGLLSGGMNAAELAQKSGMDSGYVNAWCDAAFAFELLDWDGSIFSITDKGRFMARERQSLLQVPAQTVLTAHMMERAATLMKTGERPGEKVLGERESILPLFGEMLERSFGTMFAGVILPELDLYDKVNASKGSVMDLGCGNGWDLRKVAEKYPDITCYGVDGFGENVSRARELARTAGLENRINIAEGDIYTLATGQKYDVIVMNRALHHVWDKKEKVFEIAAAHLNPGGTMLVWEPHWPKDKNDLRKAPWKGIAVQNLAEYIQGNRFLHPEEIAAEMNKAGLVPDVKLFMNNAEAIVAGVKKDS